MKQNMFYSSFRSTVIGLAVAACLFSQAFLIVPAPAKSFGSQINPVLFSAILGGCPLFPSNNIWNTPIDNLPVHGRSDQWVNTIGRTMGFHMDFGSGTWAGGPIGIPYNLVGSNVPKVPVSFYYPTESDPGPYPIPTNPLIEYGSDHHILIVDNSACTLYELYDASYSGGAWHAGSGAIWNLNSNALRPDTWTSADAAGLPILPGLVRYDEILSGKIDHAIRFTAANTNGYIWPARHLTSNNPSAPQIPPMGARFRLKASYNIAGYPAEMQVILKAMKTYGIILADNGSNWYVSGAPDARWNNTMLHLLDALTGNDFEAVDESSLMVNRDSGATGFTISGNTGVAGVTLSYVDGTPKTVTSQPDGSYSLQVLNHWSGTVTPSHTCYTFNPASHPYGDVTANQTGQNFAATFNPASGCANVNVKIGSTSLGQYGIPSAGKLTPSFPGTFNGPVHIASTNSRNIFVSERAIYGNSFTETLGVPGDQLTTDYWFPWYDGLTMRTWISIGAPDTNMQTAAVDIYIGGTKMNSTSYQIAPGGLVTPTPIFPGTFNGPVEVKSTNGQNILVSERAIYGNSFTETLGVPGNQLTTDYWFPWYDGMTMRTWISIGAPDTNTQAAMVDIYIGGTKMNTTSYQVAPGGLVSPTPTFPGTFNGPVEVRSTNGQEIFVSERAIYGNSFTETLGVPGNQLTTDYWFSWYDGLTMRTWISLGAPDTNTQDALVDIYIGGTKMNASSYHVAPGGQVSPTPNFPGMFNGPVEVVSTNGENIFVSERAIYGGSFAETVGMADNRLTTDYWFPWYDWLTMRTWLSLGVP